MICYLMHRDDKAAMLKIDEDTNQMVDARIINPELTPYLGSADKRKISFWLKNRSIPAHRSQIEVILQKNHCQSPEDFMYKNLGLSMMDSYWLKPEGSDFTWDAVNLYDNAPGRMPFGNEWSFTPDASLGGQMPKYIDTNGEVPLLVKHTNSFSGLQCFNEVIASTIHRRQGWQEYVNYDAIRTDDDMVTVTCPLFTNKNMEFISAVEIMDSQKQPNNISNYDFYIEICSQRGIENARAFMDYMTLTDFIMTNTDRHLNNFGILRDAETLSFVSMAPIFDTGNSMFYNNMQIGRPLSRAQILNIPITAFHRREEQMLKYVQDRNCVAEGKLPVPSDVRDYLIRMDITHETAEMISQNYGTKLDLFHEFQHGQNPSLYHEKQQEREG